MPAGNKRKSAPGTPPPLTRTPSLRIIPGVGGTRHRAVLTLGHDEIDLADSLVGPIAFALWQLRGGDSTANWVDAESILDDLLSRAAATAPLVEVKAARKPAHASV